MKKIIFIFLLSTYSLFAQKKEKIIFIYDINKDTIVFNKKKKIYKIGNNQTYQFIEKKHKQTEANYSSIKKYVITIDDFVKKNKTKKFPEYYNEYSFYIFIKNNYKYGCLIEVEKIWLVEDKIID
ncbi:hypothetical protein [Polaribacter atrinae]|uniref:Uncharacterized protein n=1 Tax=Polaribacter atrinae TaxID=1333662 RepID=A0A176T2L2_9FLAO|nr:hypothetical protein [Polaribacter atrinae]OAD42118.1 hypothetical protein LPB303_15200 [Polaribacter atrinae]